MSAFLMFSFLCFILTVQGQVPGDLRLVRNGSSSTSYSYGRLQVYVGGQWGEVCGDDFSKVERDVACHQLGYIDSIDNTTNNSYGDIGTLMLSEVDCLGNDDYLHLLRCSYKTGVHSCQRNYVSLYCNTTRLWDNPYTGQLRLVNGDTTSEGMVLVYCNGTWGTICAIDSFNDGAADLICRQLGYTSAKAHGYTNQNSRGPIWFDSLTCNPSNSVCLGTCAVCPTAPPSTGCSHYYDLTIQCVYEALHYTFGSNVSSCSGFEAVSRPRLGEVRQVAGGLVEVVYGANNDTINNTWVPICGSNSSTTNLYNARTLCQQLGYNQLINYTIVPSSRPNDNQLNVYCSGEYPHVLWCSRTFITCNTSLAVICNLSTSNYYTGQVRLVGGQYPSEGRVEVYDDNQNWVSVSNSNYRVNENADSVCRQLGYTGSIAVSVGTLPGNSTNVYTYANCGSSSSRCFSYCLYYPYRSTPVSSSHHDLDLFVNCTFNVHQQVSIGSRSYCRLYIYSDNSSSNHAGAIVAGVTIPLVAILIMISTTTIIIACYYREKKASRRRRQAARDNVRYNTTGGQNIAYVVQPGPGGYMTTPQGMILVPVVPAPAAANQVAPNPNTARSEEEDKNEPPSIEEYTPLPPTTQAT